LNVSKWHVVPDDWKPRLRAHLRATCGEDRDWLSARDFRGDQADHLRFDDGSFALFRYAFALLDEAGGRCVVSTEHCGYHVFLVGAGGADVVRLTPVGRAQDAAADGGRGLSSW
jgi:hypothetical protein